MAHPPIPVLTRAVGLGLAIAAGLITLAVIIPILSDRSAFSGYAQNPATGAQDPVNLVVSVAFVLVAAALLRSARLYWTGDAIAPLGAVEPSDRAWATLAGLMGVAVLGVLAYVDEVRASAALILTSVILLGFSIVGQEVLATRLRRLARRH